MKERLAFCLGVALLVSGCTAPQDGRTATTADSTPPPPSSAQPDTNPEHEERIHRIERGLIPFADGGEILWEERRPLAERMAHYGVPGVGIAVINDFRVEWAEGYGVTERGRDERVTAQTLFHAASITKPVSASAVLVLVESGSLKLDESVNGRLRSWRIPGNEFTRSEPVTLRQLLSHTAGLTDGFTEGKTECCFSVAGEAPVITVQQMLEADPATGLPRPTRVTATPGAGYRYSNLGYGIVQLLVEDVTKRPFAEIMQTTVLGPLGMNSSTYEQPLPVGLRPRAATEHDARGRPFEGKRHHFPLLASGGLWTTPTDMARFLIETMLSLQGKSNQVLSQPMTRRLLEPQADIPDHPLKDARSLGFDLAGEGRAFRFMHTGSTWGSSCIFWAFPQTGQGAVVMTNAGGSEGLIRLEILFGIAAEYGWPFPD